MQAVHAAGVVLVLLGSAAVARADDDEPSDPDLVVEPTVVDFGEVERGESRTREIKLKNRERGDDGRDVRITGIHQADTADCAPFRIHAPALPFTMRPGQDATWQVTMASDAVGSHSCTIDFVDDDGDSDFVTLSVDIVGPIMTVQPTTIAFGDVMVGGEAVERVSISNEGTAPLTISAIAPGGSADFVLSGVDVPDTVPARGSRVLTITYRPSAAAADTGTVTITGDADPPSSTVMLSGTGVGMNAGPYGAFRVDPVVGDFGTVCRGQKAVRRFTLTSTGTADILVTRPTIDGGDGVFGLRLIDPRATDYPRTLAPAETVTVEVTAAPPSEGVSSATLQIPHDAADGGTTEIALTVSAITSGIGVSPSTLAFAERAIGARSDPTEVSVSNCGTAPLEVQDLDVVGPDASAFDVGGTLPPPTVMAPVGGSLRWTVAFSPQHAGEHRAALAIEHGSGTLSIPLAGLGAGSDDFSDGTSAEADSYYGCACRASGDAGTGVATAVVLLSLLRRRDGAPATDRARPGSPRPRTARAARRS